MTPLPWAQHPQVPYSDTLSTSIVLTLRVTLENAQFLPTPNSC